MNYFVKRLIFKNFLKKLETELIQSIEYIPTSWTKTELLWHLKEKTLKFAWFPVVERRTKKYKDYKG